MTEVSVGYVVLLVAVCTLLYVLRKRDPGVDYLRLHSNRIGGDIFLNQKILHLDKLINQQEGILANKVINGTFLLGDILTYRHDLHHYQLTIDENLRIPLHSTTHNINNIARFFQSLRRGSHA